VKNGYRRSGYLPPPPTSPIHMTIELNFENVCVCESVCCECLRIYVCMRDHTYIYIHSPGYTHENRANFENFEVSFAEYTLFYRTLLQERPMILRSYIYIHSPGYTHDNEANFENFIHMTKELTTLALLS